MKTADDPPFTDDATHECFAQLGRWLAASVESASHPLVVGIGGPGGSGKSTLARWLLNHLPHAALLALDDFRLPRACRPPHARYGSHPDANDLASLRRAFADFRSGLPIRQPVFDALAGDVLRELPVAPAPLLLADGEIAAHDAMRPLFDRLILVETHWSTQLLVRLTRDVRQRRYPLAKALSIFLQSNLRHYPRFALRARHAADAIAYRHACGFYSLRPASNRH
jgi:uridine kinase